MTEPVLPGAELTGLYHYQLLHWHQLPADDAHNQHFLIKIFDYFQIIYEKGDTNKIVYLLELLGAEQTFSFDPSIFQYQLHA